MKTKFIKANKLKPGDVMVEEHEGKTYRDTVTLAEGNMLGMVRVDYTTEDGGKDSATLQARDNVKVEVA